MASGSLPVRNFNVWTDASHHTKDKHAGCAIVCFSMDATKCMAVAMALGKIRTSLDTEIHAHDLALDAVDYLQATQCLKGEKRFCDQVFIHTNAKWAEDRELGVLYKDWKPDSAINATVVKKMRKLMDKGIGVEMNWVKAHSGNYGNEIADEFAKMAADRSKEGYGRGEWWKCFFVDPTTRVIEKEWVMPGEEVVGLPAGEVVMENSGEEGEQAFEDQDGLDEAKAKLLEKIA